MFAKYISRRCLAIGTMFFGVWLAGAILLPTLLVLYNGVEEWTLIAEINNITPLEQWFIVFWTFVKFPAYAMAIIGASLLFLVQARDDLKGTSFPSKLALPIAFGTLVTLALFVEAVFRTGLIDREPVVKVGPVFLIAGLILALLNKRPSGCETLKEGNS